MPRRALSHSYKLRFTLLRTHAAAHGANTPYSLSHSLHRSASKVLRKLGTVPDTLPPRPLEALAI